MLALLASLPTRVVQTTLGPISGTFDATYKVEKYFGVPYAQPPLQHLRFAPPTPHASWTAVRSSTSHGHCCVPGHPHGYLLGREDCLVLDIYAPATSVVEEAEARPVLWEDGKWSLRCRPSQRR